jgi:predicted nucleic acid-binding protein
MTMTNVADPLFIDTNVLVYAAWHAAPLHTQARTAIATHRAAGAQLVISRQIIREFLATLNRPQSGIALATLVREVRAFEVGMIVGDETAATTAALLTLLPQAAGARVHDVNIVATMQVYGVQRILTNNPGDFVPFAHMITIIPLV